MASSVTEVQFSDLVGTTSIFLFVSFISYGILCAQAYEYLLAFRNDSWVLKAVTGAVMFFETLHCALTLHTLYFLTIVAADNPQTVLDIPWDAGAITLADTLVVLIVQMYYVWRIWILSMRSRALVVILVCIVPYVMSALEVNLLVRASWFVYVAVSPCIPSRKNSESFIDDSVALELVVMAYLLLPATSNFVLFRSNHISSIVYISWLSFGAVGDVLMAVSVGTYLVRRRTGFRSTDTIIRKAVALSVNSGAITATVAVAALVTFIIIGNRSIVCNALMVIETGLYGNSLFGMLNARQIFRRNLEADNDQVPDPSTIVFRDHVGTRSSEFKSSERSRLEF